jgi:hypothetical protein
MGEAQPPGTNAPGFTVVVRWLSSSVGVLGLLVAVGFLVDRAARDRLGLSFTAGADPVRLAALAGEFLAVSVQDVLLTIQSIVRLPTWTETLVALGVGVALGYLYRALDRSPDKGREWIPGVIRLVWLAGAISGIASAVVLVDLPALLIRDMLLSGPRGDAEIEVRGLIGNHARRAYRDQVCARITLFEGLATLAQEENYCAESPAVALMNTRDRQRAARERIESRFGWAYLAGVVAALTLALRSTPIPGAVSLPPLKSRGRVQTAQRRIRTLLGRDPRALPDGIASGDHAGGMLLTGLTLLHVVLLPLVYGKTRQSTEFPVGIVSLRTRGDSVFALSGAFVLGQTDRELVTYTLGILQAIPFERVYQVDVRERRDVLAAKFDEVIGNTPRSPSPEQVRRPSGIGHGVPIP